MSVGTSAATRARNVGAAAPPLEGPASTAFALCERTVAVTVPDVVTAVLGVEESITPSPVNVTLVTEPVPTDGHEDVVAPPLESVQSRTPVPVTVPAVRRCVSVPCTPVIVTPPPNVSPDTDVFPDGGVPDMRLAIGSVFVNEYP